MGKALMTFVILLLVWTQQSNAQVQVGDTVRLKPLHGRTLLGSVTAFSRDSIALTHALGTTVFSMLDVRRLDVQKPLKRSRVQSIIIGTALGAALGALLGVDDFNNCKPDGFLVGCPQTLRSAVVQDAALFGGIGFTVGFVIGGKKHEWVNLK